jgi:hypothetical protein
MSRKPKTQAVDDDNPEWTAQEAAAAMRFAELPATLQAKLRSARRLVQLPVAQMRKRAAFPSATTSVASF